MKSPIVPAAILTMGLAMPAAAAINLEFRPVTPSVNACDTLRVGLYAVSDNGLPQSLAAVTVVFEWDPSRLHMLGRDMTGSVLTSSSFPAGDPFGLNEASPPQDGDGLLIGFAPIGSPVNATAGGVLLTTLEFEALVATPATAIDILEGGGGKYVTFTTVYDGVVPGLEVTGVLQSASVAIVGTGDCGADPCPPDVNNDGQVNVQDIIAVIKAWGTKDAGADINDDGIVNVSDLVEVIKNWGPCAD